MENYLTHSDILADGSEIRFYFFENNYGAEIVLNKLSGMFECTKLIKEKEGFNSIGPVIQTSCEEILDVFLETIREL